MNQELIDLFQKKQQQASRGDRIDWDDRRERYLAAVRELYSQVEAMLAEPIRQKAVLLQRRPKQLTESYIGTYSVEDLVLLAGDEQVRFSPRGRNVAGASGRVDVVGDRGEAILIVQPDGRWSFVQSRQPTTRVVPLSDSSLAEVLRLVMRD